MSVSKGRNAKCPRNTLCQTFLKRLLSPTFLHSVEVLSDIARKDQIVQFLLRAYGGTLMATFGLFYLQGFGLVHLPQPTLHWLGAATIGELTGLLALTIRSVFAKK